MQLSSRPPSASFKPVYIPEDQPVYQILDGKFFGVDENGNDRLYESGSVIAYHDEPNLEMKPLNAMAWKVMREFLDKLDKLGKDRAEKNGVGFVSYRKAFEDAHAANSRQSKGVALLGQEADTPIMQGKRTPTKTVKIEPEAEAAPISLASSGKALKAAAKMDGEI